MSYNGPQGGYPPNNYPPQQQHQGYGHQQPQYPAAPQQQQQQGGLPAHAPPGFAMTARPTGPSGLAAQAKAEMDKNYSGNDRTDIDWFDFPLPKTVGQYTETYIRILPAKDPGGRFWARTELHFGDEQLPDGKIKKLAWDCAAIEGHKCAGLDEKIKFFTKAKELGESADNPGPNRAMGFKLGTKTRYLFNAIILSDQQRHFRDGQLFPAIIRGNKVFGEAIMGLEQYQGPISDWQWGYNIVVKIKKIGHENYQVEYDQIVPVGDRCPIEQQWWPALQNLYDLDELITPLTPADETIMFQRCWPHVFGNPPVTMDTRPAAPSLPSHPPQGAPQGFQQGPPPQGHGHAPAPSGPPQQAPPGSPPFNSGHNHGPPPQPGPPQGAFGGGGATQGPPQGAFGNPGQGGGFQGPYNSQQAPPGGPVVDVPSEFAGPATDDDVPF